MPAIGIVVSEAFQSRVPGMWVALTFVLQGTLTLKLFSVKSEKIFGRLASSWTFTKLK
jgi:hypothetical protein